jgi:small-conductance mechanosensitive channel
MKNKKITLEAVPYAYYSKVLQQPFDSIEELLKAESAYEIKKKLDEEEAAKAKEKAKEDEAAVKTAFRLLNEAKKKHAESIDATTKHYREELDELQDNFKKEIEIINDRLEHAEQVYAGALKLYEEKHPEGYHLVLKDGENETVISKSSIDKAVDKFINKPIMDLDDLFSLFFGRNEK